MPMEGTTEPIEMLTVSDENIVIEEHLTRKNDGWVISFSITSKCESAVAIRISVPMPDVSAMLDTGFHPRHKPRDWEMENDVLTFEDEVPRDEPLQILLGVVLVDDKDVSLSLPEPTIVASQPVDSADEAVLGGEDAPLFRNSTIGAGNQSQPSADGPGSNDDLNETADPDLDPDEATEPAQGSSDIETGDQDDADSATATNDEAGISNDVSSSPGDADTDSDTAFDMDRLSEFSADIAGDAADSDDGAAGPTADTDASEGEPDSFGEFLTSQADEAPEAAEDSLDPAPDADPERPADGADDVLAKLLDQLESTDEESDRLQALRAKLAPESQKATDVRIQHIQSRMDDLAAYTEALEGLINKHGTASSFMEEIERELDDLNTQVDSIRNQTQSAETERRDFEERLADVESSVEAVGDDLRSSTEDLSAELDTLRDTVDSRERTIQTLRETVNDHDERLESVTDRIESTESDLRARLSEMSEELAAVETRLDDHQDELVRRLSELDDEVSRAQRRFETEFSQLQDQVESLAQMREVFARAFSQEDFTEEMEASSGTTNGDDPATDTE